MALQELQNYEYLFNHGITRIEELVGLDVYFTYPIQGVVRKQIRKITYHKNNCKWMIDAGSAEPVENLGVSYFLSEDEAVKYQFEMFETYTKQQQERILKKEFQKRVTEIKELERLLEKYPTEESRKLIEVSCKTCRHNVEFPEPHTCDECTSLFNEKEYNMWEPKIDLFFK